MLKKPSTHEIINTQTTTPLTITIINHDIYHSHINGCFWISHGGYKNHKEYLNMDSCRTSFESLPYPCSVWNLVPVPRKIAFKK